MQPPSLYWKGDKAWNRDWNAGVESSVGDLFIEEYKRFMKKDNLSSLKFFFLYKIYSRRVNTVVYYSTTGGKWIFSSKVKMMFH